LDLNESTLLAGLPQAPSAYALSTNKERALERQEEVVSAMVSNDMLTAEEAEALLAE
ncbi:MAG: transglycosylase domain-containing protein, partial [Firmicutes bacterium]|nr:transglycosylase domain-containing protein [Bacillota bacterium]